MLPFRGRGAIRPRRHRPVQNTMSIRYDKRNQRWRYEFDRIIQGRRHRYSRLLPKGWSQAQANAFDAQENARLHATATGLTQTDPLIETAVAHYLTDKKHLKSHKSAAEHLAAILPHYIGRPVSDLPEVSKAVCAEPFAPATNRNRLALLKAACRWAWKQHSLTTSDPTIRMQLPPVKNERHVYATRAEMIRLCLAADRHDVRVMIRAAFYTGMRLGELMRVEVIGSTLVLADSKNGERRAIPAHPRLYPLLRYLPLTAPKITLQRAFQRARVRAELPHIHIHDLRHSAASEMVNAGVNLYVVGAVLGHKDARSTRRYAHLTGATLMAAVGTIGKNPRTLRTPSGDKLVTAHRRS